MLGGNLGNIYGGREEHTIDLCVGLRSAGHEVLPIIGPVLVRDRFKERDFEVGKVWRYDLSAGKPIKRAFRLYAIAPYRIRRLVDQIKGCDLLHVQTQEDFYYGVKAAQKVGIPVVLTPHAKSLLDQYRIQLRNYPFNLMEKYALENADGIVFNSEHSKNEVLGGFWIQDPPVTENIKVIYFTTGTPFTPQKRDGVTFTIGIMGRLHWAKRYDVVFKAIASIVKQIGFSYNLVLEIWGHYHNDSFEYFQKMVTDLGIDPWVRWKGFIEDPVDAWDRFDIAIFPAEQKEGFGLVKVDAFKTETPLIVIANGGSVEGFTADVHALVVHNFDEYELVKHIQHLMIPDVRKEMAYEANIFAKEFYTTERMIREHEEVYEVACA